MIPTTILSMALLMIPATKVGVKLAGTAVEETKEILQACLLKLLSVVSTIACEKRFVFVSTFYPPKGIYEFLSSTSKCSF